MKLYVYINPPLLESILKNGYLSASKQDDPPILYVYKKYAGSEKREDIIGYLENTFKGRFRSISCLTAPAPIDNYKHPYLDSLVKSSMIISFDVENMMKDGIIEAIYCKDCSQTAKKSIDFENIYKVEDLSHIDFSPLDWHSCDTKYGSPFNMIRHYMIILKDGLIPPKYIKRGN